MKKGGSSNGHFVFLLGDWKTSILETNPLFGAHNFFYVPVHEFRYDDDIESHPRGYYELHHVLGVGESDGDPNAF